MKDTFYFSHDYNSRSDDKIKSLIRKYGMTGYGIFWSIVEDLYQNANALQSDYSGIAFDLHTKENIVKSIIIDFDLFVIENNKFGSLSIQSRLDERNYKSGKARESAFKRWNKDANALRTHCDGNAIKERKVKERKVKENKVKENKVKENKVKEIKEKKIKEKKTFLPPTVDLVKNYFIENGYTEKSGEKAFKYYDVADWVDSKGNKVLNWKQKMQVVWFKPENEINNTHFKINDYDTDNLFKD